MNTTKTSHEFDINLAGVISDAMMKMGKKAPKKIQPKPEEIVEETKAAVANVIQKNVMAPMTETQTPEAPTHKKFASAEEEARAKKECTYPKAKRAWRNAHFNYMLHQDGIVLAQSGEIEAMKPVVNIDGNKAVIVANRMGDFRNELKKLGQKREFAMEMWKDGDKSERKERIKMRLLGDSFQFSTYKTKFANNERPCFLGREFITFYEDLEGQRVGYQMRPHLQPAVQIEVYLKKA